MSKQIAGLPEEFDVEFLEKWLAALESGTYKQGIKRLRTLDTFCCLGVACDLTDPRYWGKEQNIVNGLEPGFVWGQHWSILPPQIRDALGFRTAEGRYEGKYECDDAESLIALNDSGSSFKEIAAKVRSVPSGLFTLSVQMFLRKRWGVQA